MKALTLWQPWASLIAQGYKTYETRSWGTSYRGILYIHASKLTNATTIEAGRLASCVLKRNNLIGLDDDLPLGAIVARVNLVGVIKCGSSTLFPELDDVFPELEYEFGDLSLGRFAWRLAEVIPLHEPVPCSGAQGLWTPRPSVIAAVESQLVAQIDLVPLPFEGQP